MRLDLTHDEQIMRDYMHEIWHKILVYKLLQNVQHNIFTLISVGTEVKITVVKFVDLDLPEESTDSRMKIIAVIMAVIAASFAAPYGNYKNFTRYNSR